MYIISLRYNKFFSSSKIFIFANLEKSTQGLTHLAHCFLIIFYFSRSHTSTRKYVDQIWVPRGGSCVKVEYNEEPMCKVLLYILSYIV